MEVEYKNSALKKILIAEHDQESGEQLMKALKKYNFTGDLVQDGQQVLNKLNASEYDAVLLNLVLPTITGIDVLTTIRKPESQHRNLPVFVMMAFDHQDLIQTAFKLGAESFFLKSQLNPEAMIGEIAKFFEQQAKNKSSTN